MSKNLSHHATPAEMLAEWHRNQAARQTAVPQIGTQPPSPPLGRSPINSKPAAEADKRRKDAEAQRILGQAGTAGADAVAKVEASGVGSSADMQGKPAELAPINARKR